MSLVCTKYFRWRLCLVNYVQREPLELAPNLNNMTERKDCTKPNFYGLLINISCTIRYTISIGYVGILTWICTNRLQVTTELMGQPLALIWLVTLLFREDMNWMKACKHERMICVIFQCEYNNFKGTAAHTAAKQL